MAMNAELTQEQDLLPPALVDREEELALLRQHMTEAREGAGTTVIVAGEAGMGKTRLLEEAAEIAASQNMLFFQGIGSYTLSELAYGTFIHVLGDYLQTGSQEEGAALRETVAELAPLLCQSLFPDEELPEETTVDMEPELRQSLFLARIGALLLERAQSRPLVVCLEDLHWADSASLQLLRYLVERSADAPLMILVSLRPEHERQDGVEVGVDLRRMLQELHLNAHVYQLELKPLLLDDLRTLVGSCFVREAFNEELFTLLHSKSGGVPLYAVQYLELLRDKGILYIEGGLWVNRRFEEADVPDSVRATLHQRLEKLSPEEREVLGHAAVQGDTFEGGLVAQSMGLPHTRVLRLLSNLMRRSGVVRMDDRTLCFGHSVLAEVCYRLLSESKRRHIHLRLAAILERERPKGAEALAYHFYRAAVFDRALPYLVQAAKRAHGVDAYREARTFLTQALQATESLGTTEANKQYIEVLLLMADVEERLGNLNRALELCQEVLQKAASKKDRATEAEALNLLGWIHYRRGGWEEAEGYYGRAVEIFAELGDECSIATVHVRLGNIAFERSDLEGAETHFIEAKDTALKCGDPSLLGSIYGNLGVIGSVCGHYMEAVLNYTEALRIYRKINHRYGICQVYHNLGMTHAGQQDWSTALKCYSEGEKRARVLGILDVIANILVSKAVAQIHLDDLEGSENSCAQARAYMEHMKDPLGLAECRKVEGMICRVRSQFREATRRLQQGRHSFEELENDLGVAECDLELGLLQQQRGDVEEARRLLEDSVRLFQQIGALEDARRGEEVLAELVA